MNRTLFSANHNILEAHGIMQEQTIICRQLFAGQMVGSWPNKKRGQKLMH